MSAYIRYIYIYLYSRSSHSQLCRVPITSSLPLCPLCSYVIVTLMVIGGLDWADQGFWRELTRPFFTLIFLLVLVLMFAKKEDYIERASNIIGLYPYTERILSR